MTPYEFARTTCADHCADGRCWRIEPSTLHDYAVPLPQTMSREQWELLVHRARRDGLAEIAADNRTWWALDKTLAHANRWRLNLRFCPECGQRTGTGDLCLLCLGDPMLPDDVDRTCVLSRPRGRSLFREPMAFRSYWELDMFLIECAARGNRAAKLFPPKRCRYFERAVLPVADNPSPPGDLGLQQRRLEARTEYLKRLVEPKKASTKARPDKPAKPDGKERLCPGCGRMLAKGRRFCDPCQKRRRSATFRRCRAKGRSSAQQLTKDSFAQDVDSKEVVEGDKAHLEGGCTMGPLGSESRPSVAPDEEDQADGE